VFANPEEPCDTSKTRTLKFVDVRFCDLPGLCTLNTPVESFDDSVVTTASPSTDPRSAGSRPSTNPTCFCCPDVTTAFIDPFRTQKTLALNFLHPRPVHREPYSRDPRNIAKEGRDLTSHPAHADTAYFGARRSSTSSTDPSRTAQTGRSTTSTDRGRLELRQRTRRAATALQDAVQAGYFPVLAGRPLRRPA